MKKITTTFTILAFLFFSLNAFASWTGIKSSTPKKPEIRVLSSDLHTTQVQIELFGFNQKQITTPLGQASIIGGEELSPMLIAGAPDLGKLAFSLAIPGNAAMKVDVNSSIFTDFNMMEIAPSKGNLYRNINPADVPFQYGAAYANNSFYPGTIAQLQKPYIVRDVRGQAVWVYPFQYNPVTKVLRVYTDITITISEDVSADAVNTISNNKTSGNVDADFYSIYSTLFKNSFSLNYAPVDESGQMLILCHSTFMSTMQPFIDWKIQKGLDVEIIDVASAGATTNAIKTYITNYYNSHYLKYVLLVGDAQQIPSPTLSGGASDPSYGYILGNDSYAEVFIGRFSAQTVAEVQTQVQRVIEYEKYPQVSGTWFSNGVCVASDQGPGDDNEMDWEHERVIRSKELAFTYTDVAELYDGSQGGNDAPGDPDAMDLVDVFNNGVSIFTYTGHGSTNACSTTGFSSSEIPLLTNTGMLPFVWSVACVNGEFTNTTCLAEDLLRSEQNSQPTGAIATLMSSINQSWDPPMDGQDEMVDLLVNTYPTNFKRTFGGLSVNGCMHMNDVYGAAGDEMTDTWHCFGDPSLNVRTATPIQITAVHVPTVMLTDNQLVISACNVDGSLACISLNGQIIGTGTITAGTVTIPISGFTLTDTLMVTITGFNCIPYFGQVTVTTTSVRDIAGNSNWTVDVYPSLFTNELTVNSNQFGDNISLRLIDVSGREILKQNVTGSSLKLNTSSFAKGIYFVELNNGSAKKIIRIEKAR